MIKPEKIISGGQTGADRAGLDCARALGIATGGWCPRGRRAEDGAVPPEYNLQETQSTDYRERTLKNVEESDGTVVFVGGPVSAESGSAYTMRLCKRLDKPNILIDLSRWPAQDAAKAVRAFVRDGRIRVLNVAGSRASISPDIAGKVVETLKLAFSDGGER